jgi:hypothetical protein
MAAVEKWAGFGGRQLFSGRTQIHVFLAFKSDYRFQPVAVSQWPDQQPSPSVITPIIEIGA